MSCPYRMVRPLIDPGIDGPPEHGGYLCEYVKAMYGPSGT